VQNAGAGAAMVRTAREAGWSAAVRQEPGMGPRRAKGIARPLYRTIQSEHDTQIVAPGRLNPVTGIGAGTWSPGNVQGSRVARSLLQTQARHWTRDCDNDNPLSRRLGDGRGCLSVAKVGEGRRRLVYALTLPPPKRRAPPSPMLRTGEGFPAGADGGAAP